MLSQAEQYNLQESSIGNCELKNCFPLLFLLLLASPSLGLGQQKQNATLESLVATAQQAQATSNYASAAEAYAQAVKLRPDIAELWANLGLMEHETAHYADAIQSFQHAYRLKPSLYVPNLFLGIDLTHTGKAKEAIPFLLTAEKINGTDLQPHLALGRAYSSLQEFWLAAHEFNHVVHEDAAQSTAWFSLGIAYLDQVETDARTMSKSAQDSPYAKALYAQSLVTQSRYLEAIDVYKAVVTANRQPPCMHGELGFAYLKQHNSSAAASEFETGRTKDSACSLSTLGQALLAVDATKNVDSLNFLTQLWHQDAGFVRSHASSFADGISAEHTSSFVAFLKQQYESRQLQEDLYELLASTLQGSPQPPKENAATDHIDNSGITTPEKNYIDGHYQLCADQTVAALKTQNQSQLRLLAACSFLAGDYALSSGAGTALAKVLPQPAEGLYWSIKANEKLAFQALERYQQLEPHSERSHLLLGDIYVQRERYDDALAEYRKALDIYPNDPAALLGLASAYFRNGNISQTVETAQLALNQLPDDPEVNLLMGEALMERHEFSNAEPFLKKGLGAKPQMLPHVHALLGKVYAEAGRTQEAINELKLGLESDEDGSAHYQLARLYRQTGDTQDAAMAMEQMKLIQQRRRDGAVVAFKDSHSSALDETP